MHLPSRSGIVWRLCLFCLSAGLLLPVSVQGQVTITLGPGVSNPPPPLTSIVPETAVADTAELVNVTGFGSILAQTLDAQGFTAANKWVLSFGNGLPPGLVNPVPLSTLGPLNAQFNITDYHLYLNPAKTEFGETMAFTLVHPPADPVLAGATITKHWIQLLHEDKQYGNFGYSLPQQSGFWQLDNLDQAFAAGKDPYYPSTAGFTLPPSFFDSPHYYAGIGTYLHFETIPSWDVSTGGKDYIIVGDTGISWGFAIIPEPSGFLTILMGLLPGFAIVHQLQVKGKGGIANSKISADCPLRLRLTMPRSLFSWAHK